MTLTVLYDSSCELCRRARAWLESEPTYVDLVFVAADSEQARSDYRALPWLDTELIVVNEEGAAWVGPAAFLMCLWATQRWRSMALQLSSRTLLPLARVFFEHLAAPGGCRARGRLHGRLVHAHGPRA